MPEMIERLDVGMFGSIGIVGSEFEGQKRGLPLVNENGLRWVDQGEAIPINCPRTRR